MQYMHLIFIISGLIFLVYKACSYITKLHLLIWWFWILKGGVIDRYDLEHLGFEYEDFDHGSGCSKCILRDTTACIVMSCMELQNGHADFVVTNPNNINLESLVHEAYTKYTHD